MKLLFTFSLIISIPNFTPTESKLSNLFPVFENSEAFRKTFARFITDRLNISSCSKWGEPIGVRVLSRHENGCLDGGFGPDRNMNSAHTQIDRDCPRHTWSWWRLDESSLKTTCIKSPVANCLTCFHGERNCTIRTKQCDKDSNQKWKIKVFPWQVRENEQDVYFSIVSELFGDQCLHVVDNSSPPSSPPENVPDLRCRKDRVCLYLQNCEEKFEHWQSFSIENQKRLWNEQTQNGKRNWQLPVQCDCPSDSTQKPTLNSERVEKPDYVPYILGALSATMFLILGAALIFLWKKYSTTQLTLKNLTRQEIEEFIFGNPERILKENDAHENAVHLPYNKKYDIEEADLLIEKNAVLGKGAFGLVIRGFLESRPVAVKTVEPNVDITYFKALLKEIKIMAFVGRHENVVQFIGAMTKRIQERIIYVVTELSSFGSLQSYLIDQRHTFRSSMGEQSMEHLNYIIPFPNDSSSSSADLYGNIQSYLTSVDLISFAYQIANGMEFLALKKVLHGDLAARNILVFENKIVKLTDFGLSRKLYEYEGYVKEKSAMLPWRWLSIESLKDLQFSSKSDVWSYAVTLWEIFSLGQCPYPGLNYTMDFLEKLESGLRLQRPKFATQTIYAEMWKCWSASPDHRPSFTELKITFQNFLSFYSEHERELSVLSFNA